MQSEQGQGDDAGTGLTEIAKQKKENDQYYCQNIKGNDTIPFILSGSF